MHQRDIRICRNLYRLMATGRLILVRAKCSRATDSVSLSLFLFLTLVRVCERIIKRRERASFKR